MRLTRRYRFSASHRLHVAGLTEPENVDLYGKCNNPYGHGHDYVLEVRVAGVVHEPSGQVISVASLDRLVKSEVLDHFEHRNLNSDVPDFSGIVPTSENIATAILRRLRGSWSRDFPDDGLRLDGIRLLETRRNVFELRS